VRHQDGAISVISAFWQNQGKIEPADRSAEMDGRIRLDAPYSTRFVVQTLGPTIPSDSGRPRPMVVNGFWVTIVGGL